MQKIELQRRIWTVCLVTMTLATVAVVLFYTQTIMVPFVLAAFIVFVVSPVVRVLETSLHVPRPAAIIGTTILIIAAIVVVFAVLISSVREALDNVDTYRASLLVMTNGLIDWGRAYLGLQLESLDRHDLLDSLNSLPVFNYVHVAASKMWTFISDTVLVILFAMFLLAGKSMHVPHTGIVGEIEFQVRIFLITKLTTSVITGALTAAVLLIVGLDMAVMFGFLAFLLNFIPTIGSIVATVLPIPVALMQFGFGWPAWAAVVIPGVLQFSIGNIIEPKMMGHNLDLHPVTILLALMFWGMIWGIPGMILATPLLVTTRIALGHGGPTARFFAELLAGRIELGQIDLR